MHVSGESNTSDAANNSQICAAIKKGGDPGQARPVAGKFCIGHRPGAGDARSLGGSASSRVNRARKLLPSRIQPIAESMERALIEVHSGDITPAQGTAMASIAGALLKLLQLVEFEERIKKLEEESESFGAATDSTRIETS